jgi:hypothetical protein
VNFRDPKGLYWEFAGYGTTIVGSGEGAEEVGTEVYVWRDIPWLTAVAQEERVVWANADLLSSAIDRAKRALRENENCRKLFGNDKTRANGFDPADILDGIGAGTFGTLKFEHKGADWGVAGVTPNGIPKRSTVTITINTYNDGKGAWWNAGSIDHNAHTLLHELGHVYDLTKGSGNSALKTPDSIPLIGSKRGEWNDWKVDQECFGGALGYKKP